MGRVGGSVDTLPLCRACVIRVAAFRGQYKQKADFLAFFLIVIKNLYGIGNNV